MTNPHQLSLTDSINTETHFASSFGQVSAKQLRIRTVDDKVFFIVCEKNHEVYLGQNKTDAITAYNSLP